MSKSELTLINELKNFGLNPTEWTLRKIKKMQYQIEHKTEQGFSFLGSLEIKNAQPTWKHLELFSI